MDSSNHTSATPGPSQQLSALTHALNPHAPLFTPTYALGFLDYPKFPLWLKAFIRSFKGPSVAFAFDRHHRNTPDGLEQLHCTELILPNASNSGLSHYLFNSGYSQRKRLTNSSTQISSKVVQTESVAKDSEGTAFDSGLLKVPAELFQDITQHLSRDDFKSLRLVCRHIERNTLRWFNRTVVVPFSKNTFNSFITEEHEHLTQSKVKGKGKITVPGSASHKPATPTHSDIFSESGPNIRRFGMSFDVTEDELVFLPNKIVLQEAFWGSFDWPPPEYRRFKDRAFLEDLADEIPLMRKAFSKLTQVEEIALSIDCGLGWLNGFDISLRGLMLYRTPDVFRTLDYPTRPAVQAQRHMWSLIESTYRNAGFREELKASFLMRCENQKMPDLIMTLKESPWVVMPHRPLEEAPLLDAPFGGGILGVPRTEIPGMGVFVIGQRTDQKMAREKPYLIPNDLTLRQQEWLRETSWAQEAFLLSYTFSVVDSPQIFQNIRSFILSRLSSRLLMYLRRADFWCALPSLENLSILVIPDWRDVGIVFDNRVQIYPCHPSAANNLFHSFLRDTIAVKKSIKTLTFGWVGGGEHAEGMGARNKWIMPAPIATLDMLHISEDRIEVDLEFPHLDSITLVNCWTTPNVLQCFIAAQLDLPLQNLTLESFSLSTHPQFAINGPMHMLNPPLETWDNPIRPQGTWIDILYSLEKFLASHPERQLQLALLSCGYVRVRGLNLDDRLINGYPNHADNPPHYTDGYGIRFDLQKSTLLTTNDRYVGTIVEKNHIIELLRLAAVFKNRLHVGWPRADDHITPYDDEGGWGKWGEMTKSAAEFDLHERGGVGRFSGRIACMGVEFEEPRVWHK